MAIMHTKYYSMSKNYIGYCVAILIPCLILSCSTVNIKDQDIVGKMLNNAVIYQIILADCIVENDFVRNNECTSDKLNLPKTLNNDFGTINIVDQKVVIKFNEMTNFNGDMIILYPITLDNNGHLKAWRCELIIQSGHHLPLPETLKCTNQDGAIISG